MSGCEWLLEGVPPDHYYVCTCHDGENAIAMEDLCHDIALVETWEKVCEIECESDAEKFTLALKWLYNHVAHRMDNNVIQQNEYAIFLLRRWNLMRALGWRAFMCLMYMNKKNKTLQGLNLTDSIFD